jgi:ribosomal protein S18 acetylase RimI-like enzyme
MNLGNPDRAVGGLAVPRPDGVELRPFGRDDLPTALALVGELYGFDTPDPEPYRARFEALVGDVDAAPFLAIADGEAAGLIVFRFRRRLNHATFEGWVSDLIVSEPFRGRGIGRSLLAAALAEWRLRGGHQVTLEVADGREAARRLYAAMRFVEQGRFFELTPVRVRNVRTPAGLEIRSIRDDDEDFAATTRLLAELGRPAPSDERLPALRRTYAQHVARPDTGSLLALLDGAAVGFCSLEFREPFFTLRPQAWIPDLIVADQARGRRIGAALLDSAFAAAASAGAYSVVLESGAQRTVAHRLYRAAGMSDVGSFWTLRRDAT